MTAAVLDHDSAPAHEEHHTSLPMNSRKLAIWTFIGSECLFFASLITTFVIYRDSHAKGPGPKEVFEVPLVTSGTAVLLFSSFFVVMALNGAQQGNRKKLLTLAFAHSAVRHVLRGHAGLRVHAFYTKGMGYTTNLFASSFFTLTGFHGTHVAIGTLWLGTLLKDAYKGRIPPAKALNLEIAALYWHFVDVVWIIIFPVVYLMSLGR